MILHNFGGVVNRFQRKRVSYNGPTANDKQYSYLNQQYEDLRSSKAPTTISVDTSNINHREINQSVKRKSTVNSYFGNIETTNNSSSTRRRLQIDKKILQDLEDRFNQQVQESKQIQDMKSIKIQEEDLKLYLNTIEPRNIEVINLKNSYDPKTKTLNMKNIAKSVRTSRQGSPKKRDPSFSSILFQDTSQLESTKNDLEFIQKQENRKFKSRFLVTGDTILKELDLNRKFFEMGNAQAMMRKETTIRDTQQIIEGTQILIHEQFNEFLKLPEVADTKSDSSDLETIVDEISQLTKNYRQILRVVKLLTQHFKSEEQNKILRAFSYFWKSVSLIFECSLQNRSDSLDKKEELLTSLHQKAQNELEQKYDDMNREFQRSKIVFQTMKLEMQSTIDKLTKDKQNLQDILVDREDELKKLHDPRQMLDLKQAVNDLDTNIAIIDKEKQTQYEEMRKLLIMMTAYKEQYDMKVANRNKGMFVMKKIKKRFENQIQQQAPSEVTRTIIKGNKRHMTSPLAEGKFFSMKEEKKELVKKNENEDEIKNILLQLMNNENSGDLQVEYKNQKEALQRKEMLLLELSQLIRQIQGMNETDPEYKSLCEKIEQVYDGLNSINNGMWAGFQIIHGDKISVEIQTDLTMAEGGGESIDDPTVDKKKGKNPKEQEKQENKKGANPIVTAISSLLKIPTNKLPYDPKLKLGENMIIKIMELTIEDKVQIDIEIDRTLEIDQRKHQSFAGFLYDSILMQYGLKSIAVKNILQLCNGLKNAQSYPYANYLARLVGITGPSLERDQINMIIKASVFFKEIQSHWFKRINEKQPGKITDDMISNMTTGGEVGICDIIDELKLILDRDTFERLCHNMIPEQLKKIEESNIPQLKKFYLEFSLVKIIYKIAKIGKDIKYIFDVLDNDKSGSLDRDEFVSGLRTQFGIYLSDDEAEELVKYLDADNSGDISFQEFLKKINFKDLIQKVNNYTLTKVQFIDAVLNEWRIQKKKEKDKILEIFHKYDTNGDGVLCLDEFETLLKLLEPALQKKQILNLFREALDKNAQVDDTLSDDAFVQIVLENKIGGIGKELFTDYLYEKILREGGFNKNKITKSGK